MWNFIYESQISWAIFWVRACVNMSEISTNVVFKFGKYENIGGKLSEYASVCCKFYILQVSVLAVALLTLGLSN